MATIHMIHGYLGAGKTCFARYLEQTLPGLRFTHDEWMLRLYGPNPHLMDFPVFHDRISALIAGIWPRCVALGIDVILDLNFWRRAQRDELRDMAKDLGAAVRLYRLSVSDGEAWTRIARRNTALVDSLSIARETYDGLKARFEPLGDDEIFEEICSF